ncbi:amine dehydrogenase large subunit [Methylibium petroleiphilum]|uniref:amine dehydrogenase large subunit n=1 Tax=Methylibium petroleiphilum TaxID=105560 RepID=UPI001ACBDB3E|nr:amine dehydrogenase large subunit [Methylibium petroleiphilum]MBN9203234.1 beta-propeller fold lactonase family protein [Methylibium petroleiphilum]
MKFHRPRGATLLPAFAISLVVGLQAAPAQAAGEAGLAYVSNQNGELSVIDLATMEVTKEFSSPGKEPRGLGVTADGKLLVTANRADGNISVIDRETGKLLSTVVIGKNPEFVRTRGHMAFVSFEPASDGKPPPKPGSPEAMAAEKAKDDDDESPAYVAVVDLKAGKVLRRIRGGLETEGIEFSADGKHILVTNEEDDNITVHNIATGKKIKTVDVKPYGDRPRGIKRAPDGKSYVATIEHGNTLVVMDGKYKVVKSVPTGDTPYGLAFDRSGERLFVANAKSKTLQVYNAKTYETIKTIPTGERCWHFTFTPDDKQLLIACGRSNEVVVIDATTLEPTKRIADKKLPWGIVTYPKSVGSLDWPE